MDGTVTESRQKISPKMKQALSGEDIVVISGASREQMEYQLDGLPCIIMAQSGNDTPLWFNKLTDKEITEIHSHINKIIEVEYDMLEDRGCQITLSLVGHNANINLKKSFDPDHNKRKEMLRKTPFKSKTLVCRIGGTTCFDYTRKYGTKGRNIARWIKENKISKSGCVYYGDAFFRGGNDESVKGVITIVEVENPKDLLVKLKNNV